MEEEIKKKRPKGMPRWKWQEQLKKEEEIFEEKLARKKESLIRKKEKDRNKIFQKGFETGMQKGYKEGTNEGFRIGIGTIIIFVITPLLIIFLPLPRWITLLIVFIILSVTIFWLATRNDPLKRYEERK